MEKLLKYARLSAATYDNKPDIGNDDWIACAFKSNQSEGFAIGFQGTDNIPTALVDAYARPHEVSKLGSVHQGIFRALDSILDNLPVEGVDVLYGHSLGGAMALIYAAHLCSIDKPPKTVYAFCPPKVSIDTRIKNLLEGCAVEVFIIHNGNDIVPMLPLGLLGPWRHPINKSSIVKLKPAARWFPNAKDHSIDSVITNILLMMSKK